MNNSEFAPPHLRDDLNHLMTMTGDLIGADCRMLDWKAEGSVVTVPLIVGEKYEQREWLEYEFESQPVMPIYGRPQESVKYKTIVRRAYQYDLPIHHPISEDFWLQTALLLESEWKNANGA